MHGGNTLWCRGSYGVKEEVVAILRPRDGIVVLISSLWVKEVSHCGACMHARIQNSGASRLEFWPSIWILGSIDSSSYELCFIDGLERRCEGLITRGTPGGAEAHMLQRDEGGNLRNPRDEIVVLVSSLWVKEVSHCGACMHA
ncbi:hypothetical protein Tco_0659993, partial [Tanacetum coccineum]